MSKVIELYGISTNAEDIDWEEIANRQYCPYLNRKCIKVRKSEPDLTIGTCSVLYGGEPKPIIICPFRLLERRQIFTDSIHLLTLHEPGNELHIVSEVSIPGGNVDYFLVSTRGGKVIDFVGIELQTLDTTGTVWPERQRFLREKGAPYGQEPDPSKKFGMNWKMTAKTILVQLHHKVQTFEAVNRHFVLVIQDYFLEYMRREFNFSHLNNARVGDSMHFHTYKLAESANGSFRLEFSSRLSTDADGIAKSLGLQADPKVELEEIVKIIEAKLSSDTVFTPLPAP